jgi:STE24 endopeptidase
MYVVVLIAFVTAGTLAEMPPIAVGGRFVIPALAAYLAGSVAIGSLRSALSLRAMPADGQQMRAAFARHNFLSLLANAWLIAGLAGLLLMGYGQWVMKGLHLWRVPLAGHVLLVTPFVVAMIVNWLLEYRFYRLAKGRVIYQQTLMGLASRKPWSLREFIGYNLRHQFLFVAVPVGLILLVRDTLDLFRASLGETAVFAGSAVGAVVVMLIAPTLIVRVWRTVGMPAGPLRDELASVSRAMRLRFRQLLVWRTGGMIANAVVMGILAPVRYVLLSDALLEQLDAREVRAVFAHEAGHILGHHLFYAMLFSVSSVILCSSAGELLAFCLRLDGWWAESMVISLLAAVWLLGFGWISRRFERQSDVVAAWYSGDSGPGPDGRISPEGAYAFSRSLERIAQLNGIGHGQWNWRHGSIRGRVAYVMWLGSTAGNRRDADKPVRRIKAGLWAATALSAAVIATRVATGF